MNQLAEATRPRGGRPGNDPGIGALSDRTGSQSQCSVASMPRNPFTDSHAISTLTDISVNDLDRVEMSTYQEEATDRLLCISSQPYQAC